MDRLERITEAHFEHWREHGYTVVENLLTQKELEAAQKNLRDYMPTWEEYAEAPRRYRPLLEAGGPLGAMGEFPFAGDALNAVTMHPELIAFAKRVLRTDDIVLTHARVRGKYAGPDDYEQELHVDYGNNTLVYPKEDAAIYDLPCITYYSDVTVDLGPTYVVSQSQTRTRMGTLNPRVLPRGRFASVYAHETPVTVPAGSTLIYSMRTFHRGSAIREREGARFSHHMGFRDGNCRWAGQLTFQRLGDRPEMIQFLERSTPEQRTLVGFPPVGSPYWDESTIEGVSARYPGMDMRPYRRLAAER